MRAKFVEQKYGDRKILTQGNLLGTGIRFFQLEPEKSDTPPAEGAKITFTYLFWHRGQPVFSVALLGEDDVARIAKVLPIRGPEEDLTVADLLQSLERLGWQ